MTFDQGVTLKLARLAALLPERGDEAAAVAAGFDLGRSALQLLAISGADRSLGPYGTRGRTPGDAVLVDKGGDFHLVFAERHLAAPVCVEGVHSLAKLTLEAAIFGKIDG
jgi:hypothetical protein